MDSVFYQEWMTQTTVSPLGLAMLLVLASAVLCVPRRFAAVPFLIMACFIPQGQNIRFLGQSFYLLRTLGFVGLVRCALRREFADFRWNSTDWCVLAWSLVGTLAYVALMGLSSFMTKIGWLCDGALLYYVFRCLIREVSDVEVVAKAFIALSVPVAVLFLVERSTGRNMFAVFGGVPPVTEVRDGRLRCQGAFAHPILAGCFWAAVLPLIATLWWQTATRRWIVSVGVLCCLLMVVLCASATPLTGVVAAVIGAVLFRARRYLSGIRWGVVIVLISLHLAMKAPVWALIQRVDLVGGSTGDFRYRLIDAAISHVGEWWLVGTRSTGAWGWGLQDVCIQYILEGVRGGLITLVLFLAIFVSDFRRVGSLCRSTADKYLLKFYWALGVALFVHCVNFIGVAYFGQILMLLFLQLAMVASLRPVQQLRRVAASSTQIARRPRLVAGIRH